jgi:hypothetical protein
MSNSTTRSVAARFGMRPLSTHLDRGVHLVLIESYGSHQCPHLHRGGDRKLEGKRAISMPRQVAQSGRDGMECTSSSSSTLINFTQEKQERRWRITRNMPDRHGYGSLSCRCFSLYISSPASSSSIQRFRQRTVLCSLGLHRYRSDGLAHRCWRS